MSKHLDWKVIIIIIITFSEIKNINTPNMDNIIYGNEINETLCKKLLCKLLLLNIVPIYKSIQQLHNNYKHSRYI